jgi:hypothetical protein
MDGAGDPIEGVGDTVDRFVTEEENVARAHLLAATLHDRRRVVGPAPVEGVVLLPGVDGDRRPHEVLVGEELHPRGPHHVQHGEVGTGEQDVEPTFTRAQGVGHGIGLGHRALEDLLDGPPRIALGHGGLALGQELVDVEHGPSLAPPAPGITTGRPDALRNGKRSFPHGLCKFSSRTSHSRPTVAS